MTVSAGRNARSVVASKRGFTLLELTIIIAIAIAGIVIAIGTPALKTAFDGQRLIAAADGLSSTMAEARREAIRSSRNTTVALDAAARTVSLNAFSDAAGTLVARRLIVLPQGVAFSGATPPATVVFDPMGRPTAMPVNIPLVSTASGRTLTVRVLATGRIEVV